MVGARGWWGRGVGGGEGLVGAGGWWGRGDGGEGFGVRGWGLGVRDLGEG